MDIFYKILNIYFFFFEIEREKRDVVVTYLEIKKL